VKVICDAAVLIGLAKIGKLNLLKKLYENIYIPWGVYEEVVVRGKRRLDSEQIDQAKWIRKIKVKDRTMSEYTNFLAMVSTEFHRYLMDNDKFANDIPANALVVFQVEGEDDFNNWHKEMSLRNREADQPIIYVYVKKWRKHSSIEEIRLAKVA